MTAHPPVGPMTWQHPAPIDGKIVVKPCGCRTGSAYLRSDCICQPPEVGDPVQITVPCPTCGDESTPGYLDNSDGRSRFPCPKCNAIGRVVDHHRTITEAIPVTDYGMNRPDPHITPDGLCWRRYDAGLWIVSAAEITPTPGDTVLILSDPLPVMGPDEYDEFCSAYWGDAAIVRGADGRCTYWPAWDGAQEYEDGIEVAAPGSPPTGQPLETT